MKDNKFILLAKTRQLTLRNSHSLFERDFEHKFSIFIIRQAHFRPKVSKQANFRRSLQKSQAVIEVVCYDKTIPVDREQIPISRYLKNYILTVTS